MPAVAQETRRVWLIILPEREARALIDSREAALALGVAPGKRRATDFVAQLGGGGRFRRALDRAGVGFALGASPDAPPLLRSAAERAFGGPVTAFAEAAARGPVVVLVLARADQIPSRPAPHIIVVGVGRRTPVLIAWLNRRGTLRAGDRPRPGIARAADVQATLLHAVNVPPTIAPLSPEGRSSAVASLDVLVERFKRDEAGRYALSVALAASLYVPLAIAFIVRRARRSARIVARLSLAAAFAPTGYLAGLFFVHESKFVRVVPVVAAVLAGALLPPSRRSARVAGTALVLVAAVVALGAIVAPFRPTAEPALTLWGSPLELNRFWGLVNHLAALMLAGLVAGWALARLPDVVLVAGGLVAAVVSGAGAIGANFVAPLWITVAVWIGVAASRRGRIRLRDLAAAGFAGTAAFVVALAASTAGPASHGSVAVERIRDGGLRTVWDLLQQRVEGNLGEFTGRGSWFVVWTGLMSAGLVIALIAALRARERHPEDRHAYAGALALAASGLAALVSEDTGVLVAPLLAALAGAVWLQRPQLSGNERAAARDR